MDTIERYDFITGYTKLLTTCWSDDEFDRLLTERPVEAMQRVGLRVRDGVAVTVVREAPAAADDPSTLEDEIARWQQSDATGRYELRVPALPTISEDEIIEADLTSVSGAQAGCCCCCCT